MKKVGLSDTVLVKMWRKLRVESEIVRFRVFRGDSFWQGKERSTRVKNGKKSLDWVCGRVGVSYKAELNYILLTRALRPSWSKGRATSIFPLILGMGWDCSRENCEGLIDREIRETFPGMGENWMVFFRDPKSRNFGIFAGWKSRDFGICAW